MIMMVTWSIEMSSSEEPVVGGSILNAAGMEPQGGVHSEQVGLG